MRDNIEEAIDKFLKNNPGDANLSILQNMYVTLKNCDRLLRPSDDKQNKEDTE
jgi:hypothetical protein